MRTSRLLAAYSTGWAFVIHAVRKLARAIHRRSVWQVVGVYVLLSWAVYSALEALTGVAGLPVWTPTLAVILLVALLPLVVATAVVQGGLPGLRIVDEVDPNELEGFTPDQVLVIPEAHPLHGIGLFTWRNAILGAVTSGALLLGSVVAYLAMWALGIGPVGSLVAQGVILTGDSLVVAQFVNRTDDASLGALVTDAFELDLTESNVVTVVEARSLRGALARRGHDPTAPLTPEVAHQMAMDEGLKVVVEGDLARRASGYLLTAEIVQPQGRSSLARFEEFVEGDEELFRAIDRLSERIREKLGESLMAIRRYDPLEGLASPSPEALTLYGLAGRAEVAGDDTEAIDLLVQAVGVDPAFAMAWRKLGVVYEQRADTARALDAYRNVIRLWTVEGDEGPRTVDLLRARIAALEN